MSWLSDFTTPPQIPLQPYPEPPGFAQLRQQMMQNYFQQGANPYGLNPYWSGSMQGNPLNPFSGQGLFDPFSGQRQQGVTSTYGGGGGGFYNPGMWGGGGPGMGGGGFSIPGGLMPGGPPGMGGGGPLTGSPMMGRGGMGGGMGAGAGSLQQLLMALNPRMSPATPMAGGIPRGRRQVGQQDGTRYDAPGPVAVGGGGGYYQYGNNPGTGTYYSFTAPRPTPDTSSTGLPPGTPTYPGGGTGAQGAGSFQTNDPAHDPRLSQDMRDLVQWMNAGNSGWFRGSPLGPVSEPKVGPDTIHPGSNLTPQAIGGGKTPQVVPPGTVGTNIQPPIGGGGDEQKGPHRGRGPMDGQIANPQPYPNEFSPMADGQPPLEGLEEGGDQPVLRHTVHDADEPVGEKAKRHLERIKAGKDVPPGSELGEEMASPPDALQQLKEAIFGKGEQFVSHGRKGADIDVQTQAADEMAAHDATDYGAMRFAPQPGMLSRSPGAAPHLHAPMSMVPSAQHIGVARNPMSELGRMLSGVPSATRRGQIASYRIGRPNAVYDGPNPDPTKQNQNLNFPTGAQTLGGPMYPWLMPYTGQRTAPMSPWQQGALSGFGNFMGGGMGLGPASNYYNQELGGAYLGENSPFMRQITQGLTANQGIQDQMARQRIQSAMAAGGNALSGATANAIGQYQTGSNANLNQLLGNMGLRNQEFERGMQQNAAGGLQNLANLQMGGFNNLMNMGAIPQQLQQQDLNAQYSDWLRQIGSMQNQNQFNQQMQNQMLHSGYPGVTYPQFGTSGIGGLAALLGGTGALGNNGWLSNLLGGIGSGIGNLFGGGPNSTSTGTAGMDPNTLANLWNVSDVGGGTGDINQEFPGWNMPDTSQWPQNDQMMNDYYQYMMNQGGGPQ